MTATHLFVLLMLALTAISQFVITPRMRQLRIQVNSIHDAPWIDASRTEFGRLHAWSTRCEGGVLLLGLVVVVLMARQFGEANH